MEARPVEFGAISHDKNNESGSRFMGALGGARARNLRGVRRSKAIESLEAKAKNL